MPVSNIPKILKNNIFNFKTKLAISFLTTFCCQYVMSAETTIPVTPVMGLNLHDI